MKLPTAESQEKDEGKSLSKRQRSPHKKTGQLVKLQTTQHQTAKPLQRVLRKMADFKLSKPLWVQRENVGRKDASVSQKASSQPASSVQKTAERSLSTSSSEMPAVVLNPFEPTGLDGGRLPFIKDSKGSRLAYHLLLVRPWFLMIGFWVFSLLGASIAVEGMISPRKLKMDLPETAVVPAEPENTFVKVEPSAEEQPNQVAAEKAKSIKISPASGALNSASASAGAAIEGTQSAANSSGFPTGPLVALVGTCAAGCLVISRRRAMMRMAAARSRSRVRRARFKSDASAKGLKRPAKSKVSPMIGLAANKTVARKGEKPQTSVLSGQPGANSLPGQPLGSHGKKRRQRNKRVAAGSQTNLGSRKLVSRSTAQRASGGLAPKGGPKMSAKPGTKTASKKTGSPTGAAPRTMQRKRLSHRRRQQGVVSVVPANASHALDWSNGSLAHQLDVRPQQRTASM